MSWVSKFKGGGKTSKPASVRSAPKSKAVPEQNRAKPQGAALAEPSKPVFTTQKSQVNELAQAIFRILAAEQKTYGTREELVAGWRSSRKQYLRMARKTIRYLEKRGIQLSGLPPQA